MRSRSGSAASADNKEPPADNIAINVSICDGKTIKLNIQPTHTVSNILDFLSASTTLPPNVRLLQDSKPLTPETTAAELHLSEDTTLSLDPPSTRRSSSPTQEESKLPAATAPTTTASTPSATPAPTRTSTPSKRPKKPRCSKDGCNAPAQPIVGDCGFCQKRFCGKHRMLESHNCEGLEDARQADKERNAAKLEGERTVMLRGL